MADNENLTSITISAIANTKDAQAQIDALTKKLEKLREVTKSATSSSATGKGGKIDSAVSSTKKPEFADIATKARTASGALGEFEAKLRMIEAPTKRVNFSSTKLGQTLEHSLANGLKKAGGGFATFVKNLALAPMVKFGSAVSNAVKRLSGFLAAIKRIAVYRAIRAALKEITQGFKEGMQNLYQYSLLIDGTFKDSMDSLATSALYLKNSLGAMVAPIVNAIAPAVDMLVDKFVTLLNTFNELIATLTGASTWTKALKYPKSYAEEADKAGGAAKKLRATLLGFDEINRLDDNSKGGRGSGGDDLDYSKMFEEMSVSEGARSWAERIKNAISGEGDSIGAIFGETINNAVNKYYEWINKIDWTGIGESIGTNLSDAIKKIDAKKIGGAIASTVNAAFKTLNGFFTKVDWQAFGKFIADGINGFFDDLGVRDIAESISNGIAGALKMAASFLTNLDVVAIGNKVGELIKDIKWSDVMSGLGDLISAAIRKLPDIPKAGKAIIDGIKDGIVEMVKSLPSEGKKIVNAIIDGMSDRMVYVFVEALKIGGKVLDGIKSWFEQLKEKGGKQIIKEVIAGIGAAIGDIYEWGKSVIKRFIDGLWDGWVKYGTPLGWIAQGIKKITGGSSDGDTWYSGAEEGTTRTRKALGGSVTTGDLFLANEHEPELIAHIGNRTQVANNDQITESIRLATQQGNAESNMLLRQAVAALNGLLAKDTTVEAIVTADSITNGLARQNLRNGRTTVAVG